MSLLTTAAPAYDLSHRNLGVLRALLTFLPQRIIPQNPHDAIVFPSNKTLSKRMNGMPESTLRRHLNQLIKSGLIDRHDSANRKRFARRGGPLGQVAFGFDLSPLAREIETLHQHANTATAVAQEHAALRATLGQLRQNIIDLRGPCALTDAAFRTLRCKPETERLTTLCTECASVLEHATAQEMSTSDSENERHIHKELISNSEPYNPVEQTKADDLDEVAAQCKEYQCYFPKPARHWGDLVNIADKLVPMIGIERPVFDDAIRVMGLKRSTTVILCMLEKLSSIHNPGGYLRQVTKGARAGRFYWGALHPQQNRLKDAIVS